MTEIEIPVPCRQVFHHLSDYLENSVDPETKARIEAHLRECAHCTAVLDGTKNVLRLVGDGRSFELPAGFGRRLRKKLKDQGMAE